MRKTWLLLAIAMITGIASAQVIYTPNLELAEPPYGYPNWNTIINNNWVLIDTAVGQLQAQYQGTWSITNTYSKGQTVTYSGGYYISTVNSNVGNTPGSSGQWLVIPITSSSTGLSGMTAGQVPIAATATTVTSSKAIQGTDTHLLSSGTVSGTGASLCTDSSGGATTSGCSSGGVTSLNSLTGALSVTAGTGISVTPSGSSIQVTNTAASTGVQYNPSTTAYVFAGSSINADDSHDTSSPIAVSAWSCNGTVCTVTNTGTNNLSAGDWVQVNGMTSWFSPPSNINSNDSGYGTFPVISTGLSSTQFEFNYTLNSGSGSGGSVYSANYWAPFASARQQFLNGHGTVYYRQDSCANLNTFFSTKFGSITGTPKYLIVSGCQDDIAPNPSLSSIETTMKDLWATAHAAGWIVIEVSQLSTNYGLSSCLTGALPNGCAELTAGLNSWLPQNIKTFFNTSSGQYFDYYIDAAAYQYDWSNRSSSTGVILGTSPAGGQIFAALVNTAFANQGSEITGPPPIYHWDGGGGVVFQQTYGTGGNASDNYSFANQSGVSTMLYNGFNGNLDLFAGGEGVPYLQWGTALSVNNAAYIDWNSVSSGSANNFARAGVCTSISFGQCVGGSTDAIRWYPSGQVVLPNVATSPSTSPICPNGTNGALTTSGCSGGGGGGLSGTVTYTSSQSATTADNNKLVIMNCSSACAYTLPTTQPSTTWAAAVTSQGSTTATIALGGSDTFNGSTSVPLLNRYEVLWVFANSATATDYRGDAPLVAGSNVTLTPATNGLTVAASSGGGLTLQNGGSGLGTITTLNCSTGTTCTASSGTGTITASGGGSSILYNIGGYSSNSQGTLLATTSWSTSNTFSFGPFSTTYTDATNTATTQANHVYRIVWYFEGCSSGANLILAAAGTSGGSSAGYFVGATYTYKVSGSSDTPLATQSNQGNGSYAFKTSANQVAETYLWVAGASNNLLWGNDFGGQWVQVQDNGTDFTTHALQLGFICGSTTQIPTNAYIYDLGAVPTS